MIESLEPRKLMSVDLTSKGTLVVKGSDAGDAIVVSVNPKNGVISVSVNGDSVVGASGKAVKLLLVEGQLVLDTAGGGYLLSGGDGNDTLVGSAGNGHDTLAGGAGTDTFMASSGTLRMTDPLVVDGFDEFASIERIQANANG